MVILMVSSIFPFPIAGLQCFFSMLCKLLILEAGFGCVFMFFYKKLPLLRRDFDSNFKLSLRGTLISFCQAFCTFSRALFILSREELFIFFTYTEIFFTHVILEKFSRRLFFLHGHFSKIFHGDSRSFTGRNLKIFTETFIFFTGKNNNTVFIPLGEKKRSLYSRGPFDSLIFY